MTASWRSRNAAAWKSLKHLFIPCASDRRSLQPTCGRKLNRETVTFLCVPDLGRGESSRCPSSFRSTPSIKLETKCPLSDRHIYRTPSSEDYVFHRSEALQNERMWHWWLTLGLQLDRALRRDEKWEKGLNWINLHSLWMDFVIRMTFHGPQERCSFCFPP